MIGSDYSRSFADTFATKNLFPFYREVGQLRATFVPAQAKPLGTGSCREGVDVTIGVAEGAVYSWQKPEWSGNQVLNQPELETALGMKPGEVANGLKIDKGLDAVLEAYGRKGYITARVAGQANFDDANDKVTYRLNITEGPQYHMGKVLVKGLPDNLANLLRGKWEMLTGDVYDRGYFEQYSHGTFKEIFIRLTEERRAQGKPGPPKLSLKEETNKTTLTVDVKIEFSEDASDQPQP